MTLVGRLRDRRLRSRIDQSADAHGVAATERVRIQLDALNEQWGRVVRTVPYYGTLSRERSLPQRFESLEEFAERVPAATRPEVQANLAEMTSRERPPQFVRMTGGSTANPIQLPAWKSERQHTQPEIWLGRSWYGITPASRLFLLWGHSHLLGTGVRGRANALRREISDSLLGYCRVSAYDMSAAALSKAAQTLLRFRPDYLYGYSVALDRFARVNQHLANDLRKVGLKVIVATAESFPSDDSPARLQDLFGCPVAMEYGAVETDVLAHTTPSGGYRVFWRNYLLEAAGDAPAKSVRVTSLYPRAFPLIRYELGDEIELTGADDASLVTVAAFERVLGRCNDYVVLSDGRSIHSEAFTHALREVSALIAYQVVQRGDDIRIRYVGREPVSEESRAGIVGRLRRIHPGLSDVRIEQVDEIPMTRAGKTPMIVRQAPDV